MCWWQLSPTQPQLHTGTEQRMLESYSLRPSQGGETWSALPPGLQKESRPRKAYGRSAPCSEFLAKAAKCSEKSDPVTSSKMDAQTATTAVCDQSIPMGSRAGGPAATSACRKAVSWAASRPHCQCWGSPATPSLPARPTARWQHPLLPSSSRAGGHHAGPKQTDRAQHNMNSERGEGKALPAHSPTLLPPSMHKHCCSHCT